MATLPISSPAMSSNVLASASLYVGDLSPDVPESMLYKYFNDIGEVSSVRVLRDTQTRRSLGYAYVNFHRADDAEKALEILNFKPIGDGGRPCRIMWSQRDPQLRKSGKGNIFIKNLPPTMDHESLRDTFIHFGSILSCKVAQDSKGASLGYGFVHFAQEADAKKAVEMTDGKQIGDKIVHVAPFVSKSGRGTVGKFTNVYVKNLPQTYDETKFVAMFQQFGTITSQKLVQFTEEGKTNYGFVNFSSSQEAKAAVDAMNNFQPEGFEKKLFVTRAQKKEERKKELKDRFDQIKADRALKYHGVNLYVKNLSDSITDEKLTNLFVECGEITSAKVMLDENGVSKGFGFVCFHAPESAMTAISTKNGVMVDDKPLYVAMAQRRADRQATIQEKINRMRQQKPQGHISYGQFPPMGVPGHPRMGPYVGWPAQPPMGMQMPMSQRPHYALVPSSNGARGPSQRGGRRRQGQGAPHMRHPQQVKYNNDVRNPRQQGPPMQRMPEAHPPAHSENSDFINQMVKMNPIERKTAFGERLFPLVAESHEELAPKITGMLLEMEDSEILELLDSKEALSKKIEEAIHVLEESTTTE